MRDALIQPAVDGLGGLLLLLLLLLVLLLAPPAAGTPAAAGGTPGAAAALPAAAAGLLQRTAAGSPWQAAGGLGCAAAGASRYFEALLQGCQPAVVAGRRRRRRRPAGGRSSERRRRRLGTGRSAFRGRAHLRFLVSDCLGPPGLTPLSAMLVLAEAQSSCTHFGRMPANLMNKRARCGPPEAACLHAPPGCRPLSASAAPSPLAQPG